jgi:hypothetical protein
VREPEAAKTPERSATIITPDGQVIKTKAGAVQGAIAAPPALTTGATTNGAAHAAATFHYLEPMGDLYRKIASDAESLIAALEPIGCLSAEQHARLQDFVKLSLRLAGISDHEVGYLAVSNNDMALLADIDGVLDKITLPLAGTLYLDNGDSGKGGCNLALGHAGYLHVLCQTTKGMMLCRGPVYSYYELPGAAVTPAHWQRKLQFSLVQPPDWTSQFDLLQESNSFVSAPGAAAP